MKDNQIVTFNAFDLLQVAMIAERIHCVKRTLNVNSVKCDLSQTEFELDYIGAMGEYAISKYFSSPINYEIHPGGDNGIDICINGFACQIKTAARNYKKSYLYFNDMDCFCAPVAIYAKVISPIKVELVGCISRKTFIENHIVKDFGYGERLAMPEGELTDLSVLLNERTASP